MDLLRRLTPEEEYIAGQSLYRAGGVHPLEEENGMLRYVIDDNPRRVVRVGAGGKLSGRCSCDFFGNVHKPCRHLAAAMMMAIASGAIEEIRRRRARENAGRLMDTLQSALPMETPLELEITLQLIGNQPVRVSLRVGQERMYVVKSVAQFLHALQTKESMAFGKGFVLEPEWMGFDGVDDKIIRLLQDAAYICQLEGKLVQTGLEAKYLTIPDRFVGRLLQLLMAKPFKLSFGEEVLPITGVFDGQAELLFGVTLSGRELEIRAQMPKSLRPLSPDGRYVFCEGDVLRLPKAQREIVRVMIASAKDGVAAFRFDSAQSAQVISQLLPSLERAGTVTIDGVLAERIIRRELKVKAYFDREERTVLARLTFQYGDEEIDPFAPAVPKSIEDERVLMLRDAAGERAALDLLAQAGFRMQRGRVVLSGQEPLYRFLTEGIYALQNTAEVYCSDEFRKMTPRKPHFTGMLRMQDGTLQLQMEENGEPAPEILTILQALRDQKRYFRLKDGTFLDLTDMDEWRELAEAAAGAKEEEEADTGRGLLEIESFRAAYMMSLLEGGSLPVTADTSVQNFVANMDAEGEPCPAPLDKMLRPYQLRGFMWMQALDRLHMGGVLADDMGLGKTLQVISLLLWAKRRGDDSRPSIVVAPTSLVYNWMSEIRRFAPELHVVASEGSQAARAQMIAQLAKPDGGIDVYITSYPLIRRDIAALTNVSFRFSILDEAQYIKNAMSVGAGAVKQIKAQTRFALTGTPMENHPGELWSIFDYALPGYLLSFAQFMHRFGTGDEMDVLRRRIRPFLLRRLKGDVLKELPEKNEIQMMADMTEEQRRVYQASLLRLKPQVEGMLGRNRIEVLAAITELRQICGHPSLVLPDYAASSGKLDLLLDILPGSLEAGHRALVFSQFTRMLKILQRRLEAVGVKCMYLDGETPPKRRIEMVEQFNGGEGQVFLISLKAGGSGLNLVGADTVIHFDPWWNPAAEDQATDRAHRIGQKRTVNVIRLITRGSIEEQVVKLGERKRELFDQMITAGEAMPTLLSQEDIRALFE